MLEDERVERMTERQAESSPEDAASKKKCPFCAEQIQPEAIKCRFCGEFLDGSGRAGRKRRPAKWYYTTGTVIIALLCFGPLALPLVWFNPRYKPTTRVIITVVVFVVTVLCTYMVTQTYERLMSQFEVLGM